MKIYQILRIVFVFSAIWFPPVQATDDGSNYLCVWQCDGINKTYPNSCTSVNVLCSDSISNPDNQTQQCPLFGSHSFSSVTKCASFQNAESHSLYCLYKCSDVDFPNDCRPKGQVCPPTHPATGCPLYHDPVQFNGQSECETFRKNGWAIEDCISCCSLAEKVAAKWDEIVEDGCGVVYDGLIFGASVGIGLVATPAAAMAFDVFMISIDGVTAVFSNEHDGLSDLLCDVVGDATSELIALENALAVCGGDIIEGCDGCELISSSAVDLDDVTCDDAQEKAESAECHCFDRQSFAVMYPNFDAKAIDMLQVGDKVLTYDEVYGEFVFEEVLFVTHKEDEYPVVMLSLVFNNGENNITLTPNHLLYVNGEIVPASSAKIGDYLLVHHDESVRIEDIVATEQYPLNVWTHNGNIVINGVSATCFDDVFGFYVRKMMQYGYRYGWFKSVIGFVARNWNKVHTIWNQKQISLWSYASIYS